MAAATLGAVLGTALLGLLLATSSWRPTGPLVAVAVVLLALPAASTLGCAVSLRLADSRGLVRAGAWRHTARLTGLGTPITFGFSWFLIHAITPTAPPGTIQVSAMMVGGAGAAALAARFTTPGE